jgi:hypothetical protein
MGLPSRPEESGGRTEMAGGSRLGGWGQNGWKCGREKQGDPLGNRTVFKASRPEEPPDGSQSVHSSWEAG